MGYEYLFHQKIPITLQWHRRTAKHDKNRKTKIMKNTQEYLTFIFEKDTIRIRNKYSGGSD